MADDMDTEDTRTQTTGPTEPMPEAPTLGTVTYSSRSFTSGPFASDDLIAGRFRVIKEIAEGGMGTVYLATDEKLNQQRALKVPKFDYVSQLPPEVRSALSVTHPNVCRVYEIHTAQTPLGPIDFLSMEFIEGGSLTSYLAKHGPLKGAEALDVAAQICAGLQACHDCGLLHRDLKSRNVLLSRSQDGALRAAVTDFGIAVESPRLKGTGEAEGPSDASGTPAYLAPERWQGKAASVASDIYALGLVFHEIITGRLPRGERGKVPAIDAGLPGRWGSVIARCIAADPAKRFASATEVADAISGRTTRRRAIWAAVAASIVAALAAWRILNPVTPPSRLAVLAVEAPGADAALTALARGVSLDLSSRLVRYRPRPPQLVIIPVDETQGIAAAQLESAKQRLGASHVLRATIFPAGRGVLLRASVVDTTTQVALREISADLNSASEVSPRLAALVATVFNLPRQAGAESVNAAAYPEYARGLAAIRQRSDYLQAVASFEKASELDPGSALPQARLAEACALAWERTTDKTWLQRGRDAVDRATRLGPDSLSAHLAAGLLSRVGGQNEQAVEEFRRAIQLDASSAEGWNGLAKAYEAMEGRRADAADAYLKAIQLQPGYTVPLNDFAIFQRRIGNYDEAEKLWKRAVEVAPASAVMHTNLGGMYVDRNRPEAEKELLRALEIEPTYRTAMNNLGALYQYQGRDADAVKVLERARKVGPDSIALAINLGDSLRRLGQQGPAAEAYRRGLALAEVRLAANPGDAPNRAYAAYFEMRLGRRAEGDKELAQALHSAGKDKTVLRRAVIYFEAVGKRSDALELLQTAPPDLLVELNRQPDVTELRKDPRFQSLLPSR